MKYIYSPSYPSVRLICYFIQQGEEITVISPNLDIIKLCHLMKWPVISFDYEMKSKPRIRELWNPVKVLRFKRDLQKRFEQISSQCTNGTLYFTVKCIDLVGLDLIARFAEQRKDLNVTYWCEGRKDLSERTTPNGLEELVCISYLNLIYKPNYHFRSSPEGKYIGFQEDFLQKYGIHEFSEPDIHAMDVYEGIAASSISSSISLRCIILGGYTLEMSAGIYEIKDLKETYHFIKEIVPDVYYKPHPGPSKLESFYDNYNIFPAYIPSEFLANNAKVVIAAATTSMSYLAKSGVTCISILDLIKPTKQFDKKAWKQKMLDESDGKIRFVQSREELQTYLTQNQYQCSMSL